MSAQQPSNTSNNAPEWFNWAMSQPVDSCFFDRDGARIHYLAWNPNDTDKPLLLLCHGFHAHARWWSYTAPFLTRNYRVYAMDFAGMGDSDARDSYSNQTYTDDVLGLIDHLGASFVTAAGHSFGGGRLMHISTEFPQLFDRLIVIDSAVYFSDEGPRIQPPPPSPRRIYEDEATALNRFQLLPRQDRIESYAFDYINRHSIKPCDDGWTWKFDPHFDPLNFMIPNGFEFLPKVSCPVDYVFGEKSLIVNAAKAEKIMQQLGNPGRLIRIPGAPHHMMISDPVALISTLQALL